LGQIEVYEWLKMQRQSGNDAFFCVRDIERGLRECGCFHDYKTKVWAAVANLEAYGYLEVQKAGSRSDFRRVFRLKTTDEGRS
jgi:hypothetical protein